MHAVPSIAWTGSAFVLAFGVAIGWAWILLEGIEFVQLDRSARESRSTRLLLSLGALATALAGALAAWTMSQSTPPSSAFARTAATDAASSARPYT